MKLSKILTGLAIITFTGASFAQNWVEITESNTTKFYILSGSVDMSKTDKGENVFYARGRTIKQDTNKIENLFWYIKISDCMRNYGKFAVTDINGNFLFDTDFKFGQSVVSSALAEIICGVGMDKLIPPNSKQQRI